MIISKPAAGNILCGSATATGTVVTVPAGVWYTCDISVSAAQAVAGNATPTVTWNPVGAGAGPAVATVVARTVAAGLATGVSSNSSTVSFIGYGGDSGATLDFTASGASACTVTGFVI